MRLIRSAREWALMGIGAAVALVVMLILSAHGLDLAVWLAGIVLVILGGYAWRRMVQQPLSELRRLAVGTATALTKTDQRITAQLDTMRAELGEEITAAGERAAVERAIAGSKQRQADYDEQQTARLADVQHTLGAMSVRLLTMSDQQAAIFATLRSLPHAQTDGETTLPAAQGAEHAAHELPPSGVYDSSSYGRILGASFEPRSWTLSDAPPQSSVEPSEPGDHDDETTLFDRSQLPAPESDPKPPSGDSSKMAEWLARRAKARMERAKREREQHDGSDSEPPSSDV